MRCTFITLLGFGLSGCGLGVLSQHHAQSRLVGNQNSVVLADLSTAEDECHFSVDPSKSETQEAICAKTDADVMIPAGALAIPSTVSVGQQGDIYSSLAVSGMSFLPAGSAVSVTAGENSELSSPMSISLPVSGGAGLAQFDSYFNLDDSSRRAEEFSVIYKCSISRCADEPPRILSDIRGSISKGKFQFKTKLLGVFQLVNAAKQEDLRPPVVMPRSGDFDTPVKPTVEAVNGVVFRYTVGLKSVPNCDISPAFTDAVEVLSNGDVSYLKVIACAGGQQSRPTTMKYKIKPPPAALATCGGSEKSSCYAMNDRKLGSEARIEGTNFIVHLARLSNACADGDVSCLIWREGPSDKPGDRIINSLGFWIGERSDIWQRVLFPKGIQLSSAYFEISRGGKILGRVCPPQVFSGSNISRKASSPCLYFDEGSEGEIALNQNQSVRGAIQLVDYLLSWATGTKFKNMWYEGNVTTCQLKGMRLPTLFETNASNLDGFSGVPESENTQYAGNKGVPAVSESLNSLGTWTATGLLLEESGDYYGVWRADGIADKQKFGDNAYIRCVLPSH